MAFVVLLACGSNVCSTKETSMADSPPPVRDTLTEIARLLPTDASLEDVQYHLYVRQQIEAGVADAKAGRLIDTDEMRRRLAAHTSVRQSRGQ